MTFCSNKKHILQKRQKNKIKPNTLFRKNYVGLIFSSQIEEYVGAKGNTLVDHKKRKYKKGIKDIET